MSDLKADTKNMTPGQKFKIWIFEKNRLESFSDGVFAIIITLLVLEIKIPYMITMVSSTELVVALKKILPVLFSWVVSFLIIGTFWLNHHNILGMAKKADYAMVWMNTIMLLFASLIPFPTHLMGAYPRIPLAVASLGIVMFFASGALIWLYYYVVKNYLRDDYDYKTSIVNVKRSFIAAPILYVVAILLAWVHTYITFAIYALIPLLFILPLDKPRRKV